MRETEMGFRDGRKLVRHAKPQPNLRVDKFAHAQGTAAADGDPISWTSIEQRGGLLKLAGDQLLFARQHDYFKGALQVTYKLHLPAQVAHLTVRVQDVSANPSFNFDGGIVASHLYSRFVNFQLLPETIDDMLSGGGLFLGRAIDDEIIIEMALPLGGGGSLSDISAALTITPIGSP